MIRTGLKSSLTLRVGLNSSILIDSNARVSLPRIIQDGDQLQTAVKVERGRADVKVNHVGLTNDFSVVTPTGALAVKGTGFACRYDAFDGTSIVGAKTNTMNAIEVHYYASKLAYYLSGGAISSNKNENPTLAALIEAAPPPSSNKAEAQDSADQEGTAGGAVTNTDPISQTIRIDLAIQSQSQAQAIIEELEEEYEEEILVDPLDLPGFEFFVQVGQLHEGNLKQGALAAAIYFDMVGQNGDLSHPGQQLIQGAFQERLLNRLNYTGSTNSMVNQIIAYGNSQSENEDYDGPPTSVHLRAMLTIVDNFCRNTFPGDQVKIRICRECFSDAVIYTFGIDLQNETANAYLGHLLENLEGGGGNNNGTIEGGH
ncbi:MAG: FecR family protein, partial [Planctomycetota bacterium]|nr:FecR family protein [Planctomycetota bacterium]